MSVDNIRTDYKCTTTNVISRLATVGLRNLKWRRHSDLCEGFIIRSVCQRQDRIQAQNFKRGSYKSFKKAQDCWKWYH